MSVEEKHARRIDACGSCKAPIVWLMTKNLKPMPVNADTVKPEDTRFDHLRHTSHFATCPNAVDHRRRK
jgi:hypothetical protein